MSSSTPSASATRQEVAGFEGRLIGPEDADSATYDPENVLRVNQNIEPQA